MENIQGKLRYPLPDFIRGTALCHAVVYHMIWDLVYIFGKKWDWYLGRGAYWWQQAICWTFIFLSGFCWSMGKHRWKRGLTVLGSGTLVTVVTLLFQPQNRVVFGVLTLQGSAMLIWIALDQILCRIPELWGAVASMCLFIVSRNVSHGFLGFEGWNFCALPQEWYKNLFTAYLGFPAHDFYSTDYFGLFPWIFLFGTGYFVYRFLKKRKQLAILEKSGGRVLEFVGRHSLGIYLIHQPLLYGILLVLYGS